MHSATRPATPDVRARYCHGSGPWVHGLARGHHSGRRRWVPCPHGCGSAWLDVGGRARGGPIGPASGRRRPTARRPGRSRRRRAATGDADARHIRSAGPRAERCRGPTVQPYHRMAHGGHRGRGLVWRSAWCMRFWTTSDLWLDEALTVNIARLPLHEIPVLPASATAPRRCTTCCSTSGWAGSAPRTRRCARCRGCSGWSPCPWPGWPVSGWAAGRRAGPPCCWWPPRPSPSATTPRPGCTRWWCC